MTIDTQRLTGADLFLSKLRQLPANVVSRRGGPVKRALRKGAQLIQREAQRNILRIEGADHSGYVPTFLLAESVVVRRDPHPERSGANERYRILVSRGRRWIYPATVDDKHQVRTIMTGRWLEYGSEDRAPTPWLVPAYLSQRQAALDLVMSTLRREIDKTWKKYG